MKAFAVGLVLLALPPIPAALHRIDLEPVQEGGPPPPERFAPQDVLLAIDPERMESATVRIGGGR